MYAHVLLGHRPSKVNIYGENKTHSHEALKKEEEEEEGREGGQESPLFFKPEAELDCGRQADAMCMGPHLHSVLGGGKRKRGC